MLDYGIVAVEMNFFDTFGNDVPGPEEFNAWLEGLREEERGHLVVVYHAASNLLGDSLLMKMNEWLYNQGK